MLLLIYFFPENLDLYIFISQISIYNSCTIKESCNLFLK